VVKDAKIFGEGRDLKDWPSVTLSPDGRWLAIEVSQGWAKSEVFLLDTRKKGAGALATVIAGKPALYNLVDVLDDRLYLLANEDAPRYRLFAVDVNKPGREHWKEIIPQSEDTLEGVSVVGGTLAALYLQDASSRVRLFDTKGKFLRAIDLPGLGTATGLTAQHKGSELFYGFTSYLTPTAVYRFDLQKTESTLWQQLPSPIKADDFAVEQVRYPSKDGTMIPMFLVHRKALVRDGNNPTLLYGYGGFNISLTPAFASSVGPFIERGGVYAVANLRGGAEYGEAWHQAGMLGRKQTVFDDFIGAAEFLIREKVTSREKLAISGRSNGGLLTSAAVTQRPDLFRAVISGVPLTDMIRYHKFRIAQLWIPEYGSSEDPAAFKWLYAYSPYHRVKDGVDYPAVLIFTAESDTRVDAMHARKMAARLQAATTGKRPILLRLESRAGHGAGKPLAKVLAQYTDEMAFLFSQLGMSGNPS
jgi:prolyl oligopeptidase